MKEKKEKKTENRNVKICIYTTLNIPEKKKRDVNEKTTFFAGENYFENATYKRGKSSEAKEKREKRRTEWSEMKET